jgi:hypothetical protein
MNSLQNLLGWLGALVCVVGGLYLLGSNTVDGNSYLQVISHGMGIYFIGKGLFVASQQRNMTQPKIERVL